MSIDRLEPNGYRRSSATGERVTRAFTYFMSRQRVVLLAIWLIVAAGIAPCALAQIPDITTTKKPEPTIPPDTTPLTMFPHLPEGRYWISGQANFIYQTNPPFDADYSGTNSFRNTYDKANGRVLTLYTGARLPKSKFGEVLFDVEETGGLGLSGVLGLAGFTNLDAVRDATLSQAPYIARVEYHQVFALSNSMVDGSRGPLSTFARLPSRRIELRVGKFSITDFFDTNSVGGDSHLQFLNWSIDQNGAYDFTGDARGYTWGVHVEYQSPAWGLRFAEALMPNPTTNSSLTWNLRQANSSNWEFELHRGPLRKKDGTIRLLAYVNNANMGIYQYAIQQYLDGKVTKPNIDDHPLQVTTKYGFGINFEQPVSTNLSIYGRFGWNNGKTESWIFTEIDQTFSGGIGALGPMWKRKYDRAGVAFASNAISSVHARYLALGGLGFVLGDGALKYARENLMDSYYTAHVWRGLYLGPDLQYIVNPGYNQARGPVVVPSFRVHLEF